MTFQWQSVAASHTGHLRRVNEDAFIERAAAGLFAVADGMGGCHAGDRASSAIVDGLEALELPWDLAASVDAVEDCLIAINDQLRMLAREQSPGQVIGSTVATLLCRERIGVVLWAGDSRLYRVRHGLIEQLTLDHNPIADRLADGGVTEAKALGADTSIVTRVVGGHRQLCLEVALFDVRAGDTFLLCTDGLYREVQADDLVVPLAAADLGVIARDLMARALGGAATDNITFIVLRAVAP